jgi:hypothetical protein
MIRPGTVMRGCGRMSIDVHPFIRLSGPPVVTVTVSADSFLSIGGRRTLGFMHSCSESNDVFKEFKTTFILKGWQING